MAKDFFEEVFPELQECADERIRKALLDAVHDSSIDALRLNYNLNKEDAIAWLEKQGEKNLANSAKTCKDDK
ncbi:MAG: hypothetical protein E7073_06765 [Bacteroidales bacterium]|nr:hypothetical protein [Bacteroidales bacterium]